MYFVTLQTLTILKLLIYKMVDRKKAIIKARSYSQNINISNDAKNSCNSASLQMEIDRQISAKINRMKINPLANSVENERLKPLHICISKTGSLFLLETVLSVS